MSLLLRPVTGSCTEKRKVIFFMNINEQTVSRNLNLKTCTSTGNYFVWFGIPAIILGRSAWPYSWNFTQFCEWAPCIIRTLVDALTHSEPCMSQQLPVHHLPHQLVDHQLSKSSVSSFTITLRRVVFWLPFQKCTLLAVQSSLQRECLFELTFTIYRDRCPFV